MAELLTATTEKRRSGANVVKLRGVLSEKSELHAIDIGTTQRLMINLAQVERVEGLRDWSQWLSSLASRNIKVELVSCSPAIVAMLNKDVEFAGKAVVKSVNARFECAECQSTADVLTTIVDLRDTKAAPSRDCDLCKIPMIMKEDAKAYFAFVEKLPAPTNESIPPDIAATRASQSRIARGSNQSVAPQTQGNTPRSSQKLVERRSSLSMFQVSSGRGSNREIVTGPAPRMEPSSARPYLIVVIVLLALAAAALAALLMVM